MIRTIETEDSWREVFEVVKQLRTHLNYDQFRGLCEQAARQGGYQMDGYFEDNHCVGAIGYRVLTDLVRGQHLYIDDLVVADTHRSRGLGAELLKHAETVARERDCKSLRLCTGIQNEGGKRFYEREGWALRSIAYVKGI